MRWRNMLNVQRQHFFMLLRGKAVVMELSLFSQETESVTTCTDTTYKYKGCSKSLGPL